MKKYTHLLVCLSLCGAVACGNNEENNTNNANNTNNTNNSKDMGKDLTAEKDMKTASDMTSDMNTIDMKMVDMGKDMKSEDMEKDMPGNMDMGKDMPMETGSVLGTVTLNVAPSSSGDGVGPIYIGIFTEKPITASFQRNPNATMVGNVTLPSTDLSQTGASVSYKVDGIPVRTEPYHIAAFLDDNANVDASKPETAQPDSGDIVAERFENFMLIMPEVTVSSTADTTKDISLGFVIPSFGGF